MQRNEIGRALSDVRPARQKVPPSCGGAADPARNEPTPANAGTRDKRLLVPEYRLPQCLSLTDFGEGTSSYSTISPFFAMTQPGRRIYVPNRPPVSTNSPILCMKPVAWYLVKKPSAIILSRNNHEATNDPRMPRRWPRRWRKILVYPQKPRPSRFCAS